MFFNLFGGDKQKYIEEYADRMAGAAVNDELDADMLEDISECEG